MLAALVSTLAYVVCAPAGTLVLSDAARVSVRDPQVDGPAVMDVENAPRVDLSLAYPTLTLSAAYEPRFAWLDVLGPDAPPTQLLHSAVLGASLRRPRYSLSLTQSATLGSRSFTTGLFTALDNAQGIDAGDMNAGDDDPMPASISGDSSTPITVELLPGADVVRVASAETTATLRYLLSRRWTSELETSLGFSGGADATARRYLPGQRVGRLSGSLSFAHTRRDDLATGLSGERILVSNGYEHWLVSLMETWVMRWSPNSRSEIGMGAAFQDGTSPDGSRLTAWLPVGTARVAHAIPMREVSASFEGSVGYSSALNTLVGTLQRRVQGTVQASLAAERTSLTLLLGAAQTVPVNEPDAARIISADLVFDRELLEWLGLQLGGQITRQRVGEGPSASETSTWLLRAGLIARAPALRF